MLKSIVSVLSERLPANKLVGKRVLPCTQNLAKKQAQNSIQAKPSKLQSTPSSQCKATSNAAFNILGKTAAKVASDNLGKTAANAASNILGKTAANASGNILGKGTSEVFSKSLCNSSCKSVKATKAKAKHNTHKSRKHSSKHYKSSKCYQQSIKSAAVTASPMVCEVVAGANVYGFASDTKVMAVDAQRATPAQSVLAQCIADDLKSAEHNVAVNFGRAGAVKYQPDGSSSVGAVPVSSANAFASPVQGGGSSLGTMGLFNGKWLRTSMWVALMGLSSVISSSCSTSDDLPESEVVVEDPVSFKVSGVSGELLKNVEAHLGALAVIPKKRAFFYVREIKEVATKALRAYGYYHPNIEVTLPNKDVATDTVVQVKVDQGKPLYIRQSKIEILGEGVKYKVFEDILKGTDLGSYKILNHGAYEDLKTAIHNTALSMGFFDGEFTSSRILVYQDQNFADIELVYNSGKRYGFGELVMDSETQELYKPSEPLQNFTEGENFSTKKVNSFISSLNQTGYYNSVDVRPVVDQAEDYKVPLEMHLERRANNNMRVGMGYTTDEGARVLLEWNKPLLNSRGDSLSTLTTLTQVTQDATVVYKIPADNPNLDYFTINASQTHTDLNDTVSDRSQLAFHYIANETGKWRRDYALRLEYEDFDQAGETGHDLNFIPAITLTRRESSGGYDPSRGYSLTLEALGTPGVISDNRFAQAKATYKGVISPSENTRFVFRLEHGANFGPDADDVPPSLRFFAGGDNSVRGFGYRDRSAFQPWGGLKGSKYLTTASAEFQFPIGIPSSRLAIFCDAGTATDDYKDEPLFGPGLGYRFISPYGIVRVDVAVGMQRGEDNLYQLHFAFGPEF